MKATRRKAAGKRRPPNNADTALHSGGNVTVRQTLESGRDSVLALNPQAFICHRGRRLVDQLDGDTALSAVAPKCGRTAFDAAEVALLVSGS